VSNAYDVVVVGSGLSGLTAALALQQYGNRVLLLEERDLAGGLCGTHELDGYEFVTACNDFGSGIERILRGLGVRAAFHHPRTRFAFEGFTWHVPPTLSTWFGVLARAPHLARLLWQARRDPGACLGPLVDRSVRDPGLADFLLSLAYPLGVSPDDLSVSSLRASLSREYAYGYQRPTVPVGGPGVLVRDLVEHFQAQGGRIELGVRCPGVQSDGKWKAVLTESGSFGAREVVSSEGRWSAVAGREKPGLAVSMLLVAVRSDLRIPDGLHTIVHMPPRVGEWLRSIDAGEAPDAFGFHLFRSDLPPRADHYTLNVYCFLPRGVDHPDAGHRARVEAYLDHQLERLLPGLASASLYRRFVSPRDFEARHGLSSRPTPWILPPGARKADLLDPATGVRHVGSSVAPPGEHAGAAMLSGLRAAAATQRALARE
jgi:phytoene dehydrogenase-like protein